MLRGSFIRANKPSGGMLLVQLTILSRSVVSSFHMIHGPLSFYAWCWPPRDGKLVQPQLQVCISPNYCVSAGGRNQFKQTNGRGVIMRPRFSHPQHCYDLPNFVANTLPDFVLGTGLPSVSQGVVASKCVLNGPTRF